MKCNRLHFDKSGPRHRLNSNGVFHRLVETPSARWCSFTRSRGEVLIAVWRVSSVSSHSSTDCTKLRLGRLLHVKWIYEQWRLGENSGWRLWPPRQENLFSRFFKLWNLPQRAWRSDQNLDPTTKEWDWPGSLLHRWRYSCWFHSNGPSNSSFQSQSVELIYLDPAVRDLMHLGPFHNRLRPVSLGTRCLLRLHVLSFGSFSNTLHRRNTYT